MIKLHVVVVRTASNPLCKGLSPLPGVESTPSMVASRCGYCRCLCLRSLTRRHVYLSLDLEAYSIKIEGNAVSEEGNKMKLFCLLKIIPEI